MKKKTLTRFALVPLAMLLLSACGNSASLIATGVAKTLEFNELQDRAAEKETEEALPEATDTDTPTETPSDTATPTLTPTITYTPTEAFTPTPSDTATPEALSALAVRNGNCRVGPGEAYISVTVFDEGGSATAQGRDYDGDWVWLQPPDFNQRCWVHAGNLEFDGDLKAGVPFVVTSVVSNAEVDAPTGVTAERNGTTITFAWNAIFQTFEVGYLLEVTQCLNGNLIDFAYATGGTSITLNDTNDCGGGAGGELRGKNKLGYSAPIRLPWPK